MKQKNILSLIAAAALSLSGIAGVVALQIQPVQAAAETKTAAGKYGLIKRYVLPKSIRGTWYNQNAALSPMKISTSTVTSTRSKVKYAHVYVVGKVPGTGKYPWQMTGKLDKHYTHAMRAEKPRMMNGFKWMVIGPVDDNAHNMGMAYTRHAETIDGQKLQVLFEANYSGKVFAQYFTTKELAEKYGSENFADMTYSKAFVGTQITQNKPEK